MRVRGPAFAGGTGLVAACDIAVGTPDAKFCFSEAKLGLSPATISPYVMRAIGARAASRYFLTAAGSRPPPGAAPPRVWGARAGGARLLPRGGGLRPPGSAPQRHAAGARPGAGGAPRFVAAETLRREE